MECLGVLPLSLVECSNTGLLTGKKFGVMSDYLPSACKFETLHRVKRELRIN
ncbi:hypothetical protein D3C85_906740 [compost metagenome]